MAHILVIDDNPDTCMYLERTLKGRGHQAQSAYSLEEGLTVARQCGFDVVFLDLSMPDGFGLDIVPRLAELSLPPEIIIITGHGDQTTAETAFHHGVWAFVAKPFVMEEILLSLERALEYHREKLATKVPRQLLRGGIVGESPQIMACLDKVSRAAASLANVLITGQTGTGKELFARAIHENSPRAQGNFVVVDCTTLPDNLVESLLFGHQRGAFTGADLPREGLIKQAHGGTLFLDEIGDLPLGMQKSFLRVLQERKFLPLGATREQESDFRLVAATHRNLEQMAEDGLFRDDLLFRIRSITIELPPLSERGSDIKALAVQGLARLCERYDEGHKGFSPEFLSVLTAYSWPGNVRELMNALDSALAAAGNHSILHPVHLPPAIRMASLHFPESIPPPDTAENDLLEADPFPTWRQFRAALEIKYLTTLMRRTWGNVTQAIGLSGLSKSRLNVMLKEHEITRPGRERNP